MSFHFWWWDFTMERFVALICRLSELECLLSLRSSSSSSSSKTINYAKLTWVRAMYGWHRWQIQLYSLHDICLVIFICQNWNACYLSAPPPPLLQVKLSTMPNSRGSELCMGGIGDKFSYILCMIYVWWFSFVRIGMLVTSPLLLLLLLFKCNYAKLLWGRTVNMYKQMLWLYYKRNADACYECIKS